MSHLIVIHKAFPAFQELLHLLFHIASLATHHMIKENKQFTVQGSKIIYLMMIRSLLLGMPFNLHHPCLIQLLVHHCDHVLLLVYHHLLFYP